jgi:CRISPR/Cas system-associated exonuclease Cas4 (RecB family)
MELNNHKEKPEKRKSVQSTDPLEKYMIEANGVVSHQDEIPLLTKLTTPSENLGQYYLAKMQEAMSKWYSKPREGYHVTDVVMCPRQRVYRQTDPQPISSKNLGIYSSGKAVHEAIQWLFLSDKRMFEREKYIEYKDIQGSVDVYDRRRNVPLEFKSSRSSEVREPKSFHIQQLKYYMSMLDAPHGYLMYQCLLHFGDTPFKIFKISMDEQERSNQRKKLVYEVDSLRAALIAANPSLARSVLENPDLNWLCRECPYAVSCRKIQDGFEAALGEDLK